MRNKTRRRFFDILGALISVLLIVVFCMGNYVPHFWIIVSLTGIIWLLWAVVNPLYASTIFMFVIFNMPSRAAVYVFPLEGYPGRGAIFLHDFMWLWLVLSIFIRLFLEYKKGLHKYSLALPSVFYFIAPFVFLSVILPFIGVAAFDWPVSFATPGVRFVQWSSIVLIWAYLSSSYGRDRIVKTLFMLMSVSCYSQALYSLFQFMVAYGGWPSYLTYFDYLYASAFPKNYFILARCTGLDVIPSGLGIRGTTFLAWILGVILVKTKIDIRQTFFVIVCSVWMLLCSGARTPVFGALAVIIAFLILSLLGMKRTRVYRLSLVVSVVIVALCLGWFYLSLYSVPLVERFANVAALFRANGDLDPGLEDRIQLWQVSLGYLSEHPMGTMVAPTYALSVPVDNSYIYSIAQGSILYLFSFLLFIVGLFVGARKMLYAEESSTRALACFSIFVVVMLVVVSFGENMISNVSVLALLFCIMGILFPIVRSAD